MWLVWGGSVGLGVFFSFGVFFLFFGVGGLVIIIVLSFWSYVVDCEV